ncbi:MAG: hypothetical protein RMJ31_02505 [Nitrososphaerota archaeon]|nr:hypothetical protein [Nitrososphaerota archaeon]
MKELIISESGVRGIVGKDLIPSYVMELARRIGSFRRGTYVVGRDTRRSGALLANAAIGGLLAEGCDVYDLGITSTPSIFREVRVRGLAGGVMITASHNPPEWNGIKFITSGGRGLFKDELEKIRSIPLHKGSVKVGNYFQSSPIYPKDLVSYVGEKSCSGLKIAIDPGGGVGYQSIPQIFRTLGCSVVVINGIPGLFSRKIDPTLDELAHLSKVVVDQRCNVGFAYDCDADRVVVVDGKGVKLGPDYTLALSIWYILQNSKEKSVVVSIDTSKMIEDIVTNEGGSIHYAPVGEANIVKYMMELGCKIGGEGSSGGLILSDFSWCRDGMLASVLIARLEKEFGIEDILKKLPKYYQLRRSIRCERVDVNALIRALVENEDNVNLLDGVKLTISRDSWVLIRPSRTEDLLRISVEAKSRSEAESLIDHYSSKVEKLLKELG